MVNLKPMADKESKNNDHWLRIAAKYSTLAMKMGITIVAFTYLGTYLDGRFNASGSRPWFTLSCALFGVILAIYTTLKSILKDQSDD